MTTSLNTANPAPGSLPDLASLAALANQFFRAVPGGAVSPGAGGGDPAAGVTQGLAASPLPVSPPAAARLSAWQAAVHPPREA